MFCGVTAEQFAINGRTHQWPRGSLLTWGVAFSRLGEMSDMDVKDAIIEVLKEPANACDVSFKYIQNALQANVRLILSRLDGPSGVLAQAGIPMPNARPENTQLTLEFDDSEPWGLFANPPSGRIDFYRVALHEFLHILGLGHRPPSVREPALIAPIYSPVLRHLQPADIGELVRRYGAPKPLPSGPAEPPVAGALPIHFSEVKNVWQGEGANKKLFRGTVEGTLQRVV